MKSAAPNKERRFRNSSGQATCLRVKKPHEPTSSHSLPNAFDTRIPLSNLENEAVLSVGCET